MSYTKEKQNFYKLLDKAVSGGVEAQTSSSRYSEKQNPPDKAKPTSKKSNKPK